MKHHFDFLKALAGSIVHGGTQPFQAAQNDPVGGIQSVDSIRFWEVAPPTDRAPESLPYVYVEDAKIKTAWFGSRRVVRLADGTNQTPGPLFGRPTQRFLRRIEGRSYEYNLRFVVENPEDDLLSDPADGYGIIDQARIYIEENRKYTYQERPVKVRAGMAAIVSDPARELATYEIVVGVIFIDGLYTIEERATLSGANFESNEVIQ